MSLNSLVPFLMGALCLLAGPVLVLLSAPALPGQPVLVVTSPWGSSGQALIENAGGTAVGPISGPLATLAMSDDAGFLTRLKNNGAWLVLDGRRLAAICGDVL